MNALIHLARKAFNAVAVRPQNGRLTSAATITAASSAVMLIIGLYAEVLLLRSGAHLDSKGQITSLIAALTALGAVAAPMLSYAIWFSTRERLENASLAARMVTSRCEAASRAIESVCTRNTVELENVSRLIAELRQAEADGHSAERLRSIERSLRTRAGSSAILQQESRQISEAVEMLGVLLASPKALDRTFKDTTKAPEAGAAAPGITDWRVVEAC